MVVNGDFLVGAVVRCSDQERATAINKLWHRMKGHSRSATLSQVQTRSRSNGHQLVGRRREMLCQDDHARSFISDIARYECTLKEQSPVVLLSLRDCSSVPYHIGPPEPVLLPSAA